MKDVVIPKVPASEKKKADQARVSPAPHPSAPAPMPHPAHPHQHHPDHHPHPAHPSHAVHPLTKQHLVDYAARRHAAPHGYQHPHHHVTHHHTERTVERETSHHEDAVEEIVDKVLKVTCTIALILWFIAVIVLSLITDSGPFYTFLGFSPVLLSIVVTYVLIDRYHMESGFLMVFPFIFTGIFLVLGFADLLGPLDFMTLSTINIVVGVLFEAILILQHSFVRKEHEIQEKVEEREEVEEKEEVVEEKPPVAPPAPIAPRPAPAPKPAPPPRVRKIFLDSEDDVKKFVASIEDKAKAINAVIGRVYSVRHGGTEPMRKKIRIDPEHYNEFNDLKDKAPSKRKAAALRLLKKMKDALSVSNRKESEVFDVDDLVGLLNLNRDVHGRDKIIDVLAKNDSDPVKNYHEGALQFCEEALKDLEFMEAHLDKIAKDTPKKKPMPKKKGASKVSKAGAPKMHQLVPIDSHHKKKTVHRAPPKRPAPKISKEKKKHKENMKRLELH